MDDYFAVLYRRLIKRKISRDKYDRLVKALRKWDEKLSSGRGGS